MWVFFGRVGYLLSCCAAVKVCVIFHMFHTWAQLCAALLNSKHHQSRLLLWLLHGTSIHRFLSELWFGVNQLSSSSSHPCTTLWLVQSLPLIMPLAQKIPRKKQRFNRDNVSSKPTYAGWVAYSPHCAHARTSTHNSNLGVQHVKETNSTKMVHMLHMLWFVANNYCNVLGTHWRLSAHCVHGYQVWMHESPSIRTSIILRWREVWLKWCSTHPRIIGTWQ